jgi:hypothetical protein
LRAKLELRIGAVEDKTDGLEASEPNPTSDRDDAAAVATLSLVDSQDRISPLPAAADFDPEGSVLASLADDTAILLPHALRRHRRAGPGDKLTLLVPPRTPPEIGIRRDDAITSFLASGPWARAVLGWESCAPTERCFRALATVLNDEQASIALNIVHKAAEDEDVHRRPSVDVDIVLAHRGSDRHLRAALSSIMSQTYAGRNILCFDQSPDPSLCRELAQRERLELFEVVPNPAGPYVPRQHFGLTSRARYVAFQDTDDVSLPSRIETLLAFAESRNADIVGCQELRCDELTRTVEAIRYPLDANRALGSAPGAAQLLATTVTRTDCLRRTGGFSTIRTFGADRQFQLRAHWSARMLNVDEFLYVRRVREGSLTMAAATGMNSHIRQEVNRQWREAFRACQEGRIALGDSALRVELAQEAFVIRDLRTGRTCPAILGPGMAEGARA